MIKFSVALVEKEDIHLQGTEPGDMLELAQDDMFQAASRVSYDLWARYIDGSILVAGSASCRLKGSCGRCLEDMEFDLENGKISLFFEDVADEELDITGDVREELLLNLPMNPVCRPDCRGLCPYCSADLNKTECGCKAPEIEGESPWGALDGLDLDK